MAGKLRRYGPWIAILVIVAIAGVMLAGDLHHLADRLATFHWWAFVAALGLALANYAIRWVRWEVYLRDQDIEVPLASSVSIFGAGLSLSITPAKLGELVKSYLLREMHEIPAPKSAPIIVAERVSDLVALLVLAIVGVALYGVDPTFVIVASALIGFGLVLLAWPRPTRWLIELVTRPAKLRKLREPLHQTYAGLVALCRPKLLIAATLLAIPAWGCECVGFALIVDAFPGAHVDVGLAIMIYSSMTIAGALSFLPGGLGVTEGGMILLLVQNAVGVDRATALDATLLTRLATLWFAVLLGLGFLAIARARIGSIRHTRKT